MFTTAATPTPFKLSAPSAGAAKTRWSYPLMLSVAAVISVALWAAVAQGVVWLAHLL